MGHPDGKVCHSDAPRLTIAPLVDASTSRKWLRGTVAFWEKLNVRINVVHHTGHKGVKRDIQHMLKDVHQFCSDDFSADVFAAVVGQWLETPTSDPGDLRAQILEQEHIAQKHALQSTSLEFHEWLKTAHHKGLRGLFRTLRQRDQAWERPFQDLPALDRIKAREQQWGDIWHPLPAPVQIRGLQQLRDIAQQEALTWKPVDSSVLQKLLRRLPNKAAGPDGISYDTLRHLPYPAVQRLSALLTEMERDALLPTQLRYTNIVLIPKSAKVERPIALTSCLYRVWNSYRKYDIQRWQMTLDDDLPWDQARPKRDCLSIAVGRMLKSEIRKHQGVHTVTCLADLSCFYDTVNLDSILEPAAELNYPPVHLKLALDLYSGPRLIQAEGIAGDPKHYSHGILQGCPQAPAISKLVLFRPLKELQRAHPAAALQTWVDDVSFDVCGTDPDYVAREAILAYRSLRDLLISAGLKVNTDKTGFISSSKETARALKTHLQEHDPQHHNVLRDLGVDATAGRHRRTTQVKKRLLKGRGRAGILQRLKLQRNISHRIHKSAIHPVMSWGAQASGLAPQRRQYIRVMAARSLGLQRSGSVDVVFDTHPQHTDPGDSIIQQHLHSVWKVYHSFDDSTQHLFWTSWNVALGALQKVRYRWQVVSGPLQALQAYLLDYDFDLSDGKAWKRTGYGGIPDCVLKLDECWPELQFKLQTEFRWQRLLRLTRYEGCHDLERPLDWQVSLTLQKMDDGHNGPALRALHQGTLHGQKGHCPLCGDELTFVHLLWQCRFWKGKVKDLPDQWKQRLEAGTEPELWQRGMVQSIHLLHTRRGHGRFPE